MTIEQWQKSMRKKAKVCPAKAYKIGVTDATGASAVRIFERGKGISGSIGKYNSTDKIYIALKNSPKKFPVKPGAKGAAFKSYKDYRQKIGRKTSFVNLRLSNELFNDYSNPKVSAPEQAVGNLPQARPVKINAKKYQIALNKNVNISKMISLEHRYGQIFGITRKEITQMNKVIEFELSRCYDRAS